MKVLLFIVNYRADEPLRHCLLSVQQTAGCSALELQVHVVDNSEYADDRLSKLQQMLSSFKNVPVHLHLPARNNGYFGSLPLAQDLARQQGADVVIFSNPDVRFADDFFDRLRRLRSPSSGMLAPAITARDGGFDQNPKYLQRLTRSRLSRLQRIYANPLAFKLYMGLARVKELLLGKAARTVYLPGQAIYAPHGATLVFTDPSFFANLPPYPCFLFGEELFVAEEALQRKVTISYRPELQIEDLRSQSVSQIPGPFHRQLMLSSVEYILSRYYSTAQ